MAIIAWLLAGLGIALLSLVGLLLLEVVAAAFWAPAVYNSHKTPGRVAVIVPAHNEAAQIAKVLQAIQSQIRPDDRLLVVADNCQDDTYDVARSTGAEVIRRDDQLLRGKGFALDFAVKHLADNPPDVVIVMDADCYSSEGSLLRLASVASTQDRPIQAHYEMLLPVGEGANNLSTALFSYRVKALVRPQGLQRLGLPCGLMGTGMAFPWATISRARLASPQIVEDLVLTLELAKVGKAPYFCYDAKVTSTFPANIDAQKGQRERWESGHVNVILELLPRILASSIKTRNMPLLALAADTAIPPLALLALLVGFQFTASMILWGLSGAWFPFAIGTTNCVAFTVAIVVAWKIAFPRVGMSAMFARVPGYIIGKLGIYLKVVLRRRIEWVRTHRD